MVKVSIIVATCHRNAELRRALQSIAEQTCKDFEIILVDDNGNDAWNSLVAEIVADFKKKNPEMTICTIVNKTNLGSARTRNVGIEESKGEYITFLDDDDIYMPEKISKQVAFMEAGQLDYSITDLELFNKDDKLIDRRVHSYITDTSKEALQEYHLKYHLTGTDTLMFRRDFILQINGFAHIDVGDEFYLMQRAIDAGGKFGYLPGCDVKAYVHTGAGGLSSGDGKIQGENALYAFKKNYFKKVSAKTRRYIRMRHYAVIAFAEVRRKRYVAFGVNAAKAVCCAPYQSMKLLISRFH